MVSSDASRAPSPRAFLDRLNVVVSGPEDAPGLLLLHGWGSSAEIMAPAGAGYLASFRIHNLDLPGHGRTPPPPTAWGVHDFAEVVDAYMARHELEDVPVLAHSNGGRIALYMASHERFRRRFSRLALLAPSGVRPKRPLSYYLKTAWVSILKAPFSLLPSQWRLRGLDWLRTTIYWRIAASTDYRAASGVMRETFVKTVRTHLDERLRHISQPVLVIWGDRDDAITRHQMDRLVALLPEARLSVIDGAGHYAYLDNPAAVQATVEPFLLATATLPTR